jgi:hypothetical protein
MPCRAPKNASVMQPDRTRDEARREIARLTMTHSPRMGVFTGHELMSHSRPDPRALHGTELALWVARLISVVLLAEVSRPVGLAH